MADGNGGETDRYTWTQTLHQVTVSVRHRVLDKRALRVRIAARDVLVQDGDTVLLQGEWYKPVHAADSTWYLDGDQLVLELEKGEGMEWWACVLRGDDGIDPAKCEPEHSRLSDLDAETRQMVEKMMVEQHAKMGARSERD